MASIPEPAVMNRGLLTKAQREFLQGNKPDVDAESYRYRTRSDFRNRMDRLEEDLELLREADEDDLVTEFYERFGRVKRLQREVDELREKLAEDGRE
jgi:DNA replication protein DnaD